MTAFTSNTHVSPSQLVKLLTWSDSVKQGQPYRGQAWNELPSEHCCIRNFTRPRALSWAEAAWHENADPEATESDQIDSVQWCAWKMREKINNPRIIKSVPVIDTSVELGYSEKCCLWCIATEWGGVGSKRESWEICCCLVGRRKAGGCWKSWRRGGLRRVGVCTCDRLPTTCLQTCPEETINKNCTPFKCHLKAGFTNNDNISQTRQTPVKTGGLWGGNVPAETLPLNINNF